jgi:hypothetical protein
VSAALRNPPTSLLEVCCAFAASMLTGLTNKARVRGQNWILMGHMRSVTMRHATCTVLVLTSQATASHASSGGE